MPESSHDLVADNAARIQRILDEIGRGDHLANGAMGESPNGRPLTQVDDPTAVSNSPGWQS
jgi:hypothetical protein